MTTRATTPPRKVREAAATADWLEQQDPFRDITEDAIIDRAMEILEARLKRSESFVVSRPGDAAKFLKLKLAQRETEVFAALLLDTRNRVIAYTEIAHGTIDGATVYPREVVREVIERNAAGILLCHNHPSQVESPSEADRHITEKLRDALALIDVRVLDHIVIGGTRHVSLAEMGWL